jgi:hypothetical protein
MLDAKKQRLTVGICQLWEAAASFDPNDNSAADDNHAYD